MKERIPNPTKDIVLTESQIATMRELWCRPHRKTYGDGEVEALASLGLVSGGNLTWAGRDKCHGLIENGWRIPA